MQICSGCGVLAPSGRASCKVCDAPFPPVPLQASGRVADALFACVHQCDFTCRSCGLKSPIGTVNLSGEVECQRCGLVQAFDVAQWDDALAHAHATADLAGPNPEGAFPGPRSIAAQNPHKGLGLQFTSSTNSQSSTIIDGRGLRQLSLRTSVSPGHPLCHACKTPVAVAFDGHGSTQSRCPQCGDAAIYALPKEAPSFYPALLAVLAADQRTDRPAVRIAPSEAGVEAILCPQCGAGLALSASEMVSCPYCHTTARVPKRLANKVRGGEPPFERFWLVLEGPSPARAKLENRSPGDDDEPVNVASLPAMVAAQQRQAANLTRYIMIGVGVFTFVILAVVLFGVAWQAMAPADAPTPTRHGAPHR